MKDIKKNATIKTKVKQSSKKETPFIIDLNYSEEYDSFNIKVKKDVGFMSYTDSLQGLPLEVAQKLNEMLEEVLIKAGSETEMKEDLEVELGAEPNPSHSSRSHEGSVKIKTHRVKAKSLSEAQNEVRGFIEENDLGAGNFTGGDLFSHGKKIGRVSYNGRLWNLKDEPMKMSNGGDFQSGVYAKGGSLELHGLKIGDTLVRTISGGIQKIKDRNGMVVYVNLATGERDKQPPLPFINGGEFKFVKPADQDIDLTDDKVLRVRKPAMPNRMLSEQEFMAKNNSSMIARVYPSKKKMATGGGVGLVGNQKRIDMNKNGKIDAEDFKILRSSMNGAWRNERKHVNHKEDYEVRYAKPRPTRTGYKGKRNFDN